MSSQNKNIGIGGYFSTEDRTQRTVTPLERMLTTQTYTVFSNRFQLGVLDNYDYSTLTQGNGVVNINSSSYNLQLTCSAGVTGGSSCVFETKRKMHYLPSKTGEVFFTCALYQNENSTSTCRIGAFSSTDGLFLEYSNNTVYFVVRSSSTGSPVDTKIARTSWNFQNNSVIDWSKQNIFRLKCLWFGYFYCELSCVINNTMTVLHTVYFSNKQTIPFWAIPILPFRCEVSTSDISTQQQLLHTCHCFNIYGGYENILKDYTIAGTATLQTSLTPIICYRIRSAYQKATVKLKAVHVFNTSSTQNQWITVYIAILNGDVGYSVNGSFSTLGNSVVEYNNTLTTFSGASSYLIDRHSAGINTRTSTDFIIQFGEIAYNLSGVSDLLIVYAQTNTSTATVITEVTYSEFY